MDENLTFNGHITKNTNHDTRYILQKMQTVKDLCIKNMISFKKVEKASK